MGHQTGRKDELKAQSEKFVEELFRKNPTLSVDKVAKACAHEGYKLYRSQVSEIRQRVRQEANRAGRLQATAEAGVIPNLDPRKPFISHIPTKDDVQEILEQASHPTTEEIDMPVLAVVQDAVEAEASVEAKLTEAQRALARSDAEYTNAHWSLLHQDAPSAHAKGEIRKRFINARLELEPARHPELLAADMRMLFGLGLDRRYIYETCRLARAVAGATQIPEREYGPRASPSQRLGLDAYVLSGPPAVEPEMPEVPEVPEAPKLPAAPEYRVISWTAQNGEPKFLRVKKEELEFAVLTLRFKDGVDENIIEVWKPAKLRMQVQVDAD